MKHELRALSSCYEQELFGSILPFWLGRGVDERYGGFFTCFNNYGDRLLHRHKFTWSQGRFVWMLARLSRTFHTQRPEETKQYLECARRGAVFLMAHARLPNGNCAFVLSEDGSPVLLEADGRARSAGAGESYDASVSADFFVVYGLAEYAITADDREAYAFAADLYRSARDRLLQPAYRSAPYPVPPGYDTHGRYMMLLHSAYELSHAAEHFGDEQAAALLAQAGDAMARILDEFRDAETNLIAEMLGTGSGARESLFGSYVNPGHTIESVWFMLHFCRRLGLRERMEQALAVLRAVGPFGWDEEYGGFPQFLHRDGSAPHGDVPAELTDHEMVKKLRSYWDNKLWWPHSEALYAYLLAYELCGDEVFLEWHRRVHDYTFALFPNRDKGIGEWIQIRARDGRPVDDVVALPVKDPFHITRALMYCLEVLARLISPSG